MRSCSCAALSAIAHYADVSSQSPGLIEPGGQTLSYKELWAQIEALSNRLLEAGIRFGDKVAVLLPQGALQVLAVTGVLNHHVAIPLQARTTVAEVMSTLHKMRPSALIVSTEFEAETEEAIGMGLAVLIARSTESPSYWEVRARASRSSTCDLDSEAILFLATSATTGSSKFVPLTASNLNAGAASTRDAVQLTSSDRLLLIISLCHRNGIQNALAQFLVGGAVIATGGFDSVAYLHWLSDLKPTWYICSPTMHQAALAQLGREQPAESGSLRFLQSTGAPLLDKVRHELEKVLRVPVLNAYGSTEAHHIAIETLPFHGHVHGSAGRSCGLDIGIIDTSGELLSAGSDGEIVVRGPAVFSGYLDDPEATQAAFHDGWFRTGDVGRLDQDGNLFVTGRLKEMINRGGEKVAPSEVDAAIASHPAVLEAAAFAVPHPTLGEDVACAVVLRTSTESPLSVGELRRFAAERLARFKVPSRIYFVDEIPRGELGKPQRWVLAERLSRRRSAPPTADEMTKVAADVAFYRTYEIWSRILDRDDLGFNENFFDAGGDSLAAINMLAEVDQRFGSQTSVMAASFLDEPTLAHLVELVGKTPVPRPSEDSASDLRVFPVRDEDAAQRLFCIPGDGDEGLYFRRLATHLRGKLGLSIIRPANTWFGQSLFTIEQAGAAAAKLIRDTQPEGPYLVGGFCLGGVVAVEAAHELVRAGADVRLILFDVYMPGCPSFVGGGRAWIESARAQWRARGRAANANFALDPGYVLRRLGWSAVTPMRRLLAPVEQLAIVQWFLRRVRKGNLPFYKSRPIEGPIVHFLSANEPNIIDRNSRFGWRAMARGGIEEHFLAYDHMNLFHESNLPKMVDLLLLWLNIQRSAGRPGIAKSA